jgi:nucleoside-diphosphate-sugar epimerase
VTVLITGASGFLGTATVVAARRAGLDVTPIARNASAGKMGVDLEDLFALEKVLNAVQPAAIINCAAVVDFRTGVLAQQYRVNTLAPAVMAGWAARHDALIVQASTAVVHGVRVERVGPMTSIHPDTDYGRSKWLAEEMIQASGCPAAVIRFAGIFGRAGPEHLALNAAIRHARDGAPPTIIGTGAARRNYVYLEDAASALVQCVTARLVGIFRMGGATVSSVREMFEAVCEVYQLREAPLVTPGQDGPDQIVEASPELMPGRSFLAGLIADRGSRA